MTHVSGKPDILARINQFKSILSQHLTCFDPGDVDEYQLHLLALSNLAEGKSHLTVETDAGPALLKSAEVAQISSDILGQIYARDFKMIDQSQMIVSFIPQLPDGMPALSSGVERELQHAYESGREVYVIWSPAQTPSPFVSKTATAIFNSIDEALAFFQKKGYVGES
jgi:hypothetical protein